MDEQKGGKGRHSHWWRQAVVWAVLCGGALALLGFGLSRQACPWRVALTIPSGFAEEEYVGCFREQSLPADVSPDGRYLALARPNSQVEVWDLHTLQRTVVLGKAIPKDADDEHPGLRGAAQVRWFADGRHITFYVIASDWGRAVYDLDGRELPVEADTRRAWLGEPSPVDDRLALDDGQDVVTVVDAADGRRIRLLRFSRYNGGRRRLDWTPDGKYLLLNDYLGLRVWDMSSGKLVFCHRELDMRLPPPQIADETSGLEAPEPNELAELPEEFANLKGSMLEAAARRPPTEIAGLVDSRFALDGKCIASLYEPRTVFWESGDPSTNRVRLYETRTGNLKWDHVLTRRASSMALSADGSRLFVLMWERQRLQAFDLRNRRLVADLDYELRELWAKSNWPFPDGRLVAICATGTWILDTERDLPPVALQGSPNPECVLFTPDGRTVVEVGIDKTARVFRLRRTPSSYGPWALPARWLLPVASVVLAVGLVVISGREGARRLGRRLPRVLWIAGIMSAVMLGLRVSETIAGYSVDPVYSQAYEKPTGMDLATDWGTILLLSLAVMGTVRLRRRWWKLLVFLGILGLLVSIALLIAAIALASSGRLSDELPPLRHALPIKLPVVWLVLGLLLASVAWTVVELVLLLRRNVRATFQEADPKPEALEVDVRRL